MIRRLISIITTFASFIGFLLIGNNAMANPVENSTVTQATSNQVIEIVNLNVSSPFLAIEPNPSLFKAGYCSQLNNKTSISLFEHLGCSCPVCTQGTNNLESKI